MIARLGEVNERAPIPDLLGQSIGAAALAATLGFSVPPVELTRREEVRSGVPIPGRLTNVSVWRFHDPTGVTFYDLYVGEIKGIEASDIPAAATPFVSPDKAADVLRRWQRAVSGLDLRDVDRSSVRLRSVQSSMETVIFNCRLQNEIDGKVPPEPADGDDTLKTTGAPSHRPSVAEFAEWVMRQDKCPPKAACARRCGVSRQAFSDHDCWKRYRNVRVQWTPVHQSSIPRGSKSRDGRIEAIDRSADDRSAAG